MILTMLIASRAQCGGISDCASCPNPAFCSSCNSGFGVVSG
jgi:hypothetical protein